MIVILGCDHCLQEPVMMTGFWAGIEQTPKARRQREGFQKVIEELIQKHHCTFIGEETNHGQRTPAVVISEKLGLTYLNIDMTAAERTAKGIPTHGYDDSSQYSPQQKHDWHRLREQHMIEEIETAGGDTENVLIICGAIHMKPLRDHYDQEDEDVVEVDITHAPWFSGPLQTDWLSEQ
jgi:hypothetical protein